MYRNTWLIVLALACCCSLSAQQEQQQQQPSAIVALTQPGADDCKSTTTKPTPTQGSYPFEKCIVANFAAYFSLGPNKYFELKNGFVQNDSFCEGTQNKTIVDTNISKLVIDFNHCATLEFEMAKDNASHVFVRSINGNVHVDGTSFQLSNSTGMFKTGSDHYYKCKSEQTITSGLGPVQLVVSNLAFEAFRNASGTEFYKLPEECPLDSSQVSDLVRIGVGICLVSLVVLVLIAYFVGRRRWSERSSYESV